MAAPVVVYEPPCNPQAADYYRCVEEFVAEDGG